MQGYTYSVFSIVAIAIHLIINFNMLVGGGPSASYGTRYRAFLLGVLAYYLTDAAWGILAGLGWTGALYVETAFFFLSLVLFVFMWGRFVVVYLGLGKLAARTVVWSGYALMALNLVALALNPFNKCFFYIDAQGTYLTGPARDVAFVLLVALDALIASFVFTKAVLSHDSVRRRSLMAFLSCITMGVAIVLQVVWPLTPFTALGCLIVNCFFQVFVIQDEQAERHAAELEDALERARAAEKARSMFFSIVSHDIRTPLNAILGYAEFLQFGIEDKAEREEAIKAIRASGTTLLQLVNDVLDLAKFDSGELVLRPEPVRLSQLTDEVFASFKMAAAEKGLELVNRTDGVPTVLLDGHRCRQVLFNLVGNAVKFTERGSVTVSASCDGTGVDVRVSDTGCGIAPDMRARIFDPFVQAQDPSHSADRSGGTGLGLSICRRIVETMGGELDVESELGKGSTFRVRIPGVIADEEDPAPEPKPTAVPKVMPKHVLVVDDSSINREVLASLLVHAGVASIDQACDGGEALALLDAELKEGNPHDFIFSDLWMPNVNGIELVEKLRADSRFRGIPVYAVTADAEFQRDDRNKLFSGILLKPLTYDKIVEAFNN